jgi:hypothetical protein
MTPETQTVEHEADSVSDLGALARSETGEVVKRLKEWLASNDARASLAAANILLDRGWGRVEGKGDGIATPATVIRLPTVAEDTETWLQQYAPPDAR